MVGEVEDGEGEGRQQVVIECHLRLVLTVQQIVDTFDDRSVSLGVHLHHVSGSFIPCHTTYTDGDVVIPDVPILSEEANALARCLVRLVVLADLHQHAGEVTPTLAELRVLLEDGGEAGDGVEVVPDVHGGDGALEPCVGVEHVDAELGEVSNEL